jgi:hypothetical protein
MRRAGELASLARMPEMIEYGFVEHLRTKGLQ